MTLDEHKAAELRKPFPRNVVGKLPKGRAQLDYVGHAAVTDRLLQVDPAWTWEPVAFDEQGLPALDSRRGLWIRLTICGVTRYGYGDGSSVKELIGDAIRNAAMRFGVALDLWSKDELEQTSGPGADRLRATLAAPRGLGAALAAQTPDAAPPSPASGSDGEEAAPPAPRASSPSPTPEPVVEEPPAAAPVKPVTKPQLRMLFASLGGFDVPEGERHRVVSAVLGRPVASFSDLSTDDASLVIDRLATLPDKAALLAVLDRAEQGALVEEAGQ